MRKIIVYIACSLDGKIADVNGGVDWLHQIPNPDNSDYGYNEFLKSVDSTLMGNKTYQQVLGFDVAFPYRGLNNYVITRDKSLAKDEYVQFISENLVEFIKELKQKPGKDIWCIGGGQLISLLLEHKLLDRIQVFMMPIILGEGIPLTDRLKNFSKLKLNNTITHSSGVVELDYKLSTN